MLLLISIFLLATSNIVVGGAQINCELITQFYESLNCKPIVTSRDNCTSVYDCSHIEERIATKAEKCYFREKSYDLDDRVDENVMEEFCMSGCRCGKKVYRKSHSDDPDEGVNYTTIKFDCSLSLGCTEYLYTYNLFPSELGRYAKYELGKCCHVGTIYYPKQAMCEVDGATYREAQRFYPSRFFECVCQQGFQGKLEEPFCRKRRCPYELLYQHPVYNFCAPVYLNLDDQCSGTWVCPNQAKYVHGEIELPPRHYKQCRYRETLLEIGDKFEIQRKDDIVYCECRIPPYMTCFHEKIIFYNNV